MNISGGLNADNGIKIEYDVLKWGQIKAKKGELIVEGKKTAIVLLLLVLGGLMGACGQKHESVYDEYTYETEGQKTEEFEGDMPSVESTKESRTFEEVEPVGSFTEETLTEESGESQSDSKKIVGNNKDGTGSSDKNTTTGESKGPSNTGNTAGNKNSGSESEGTKPTTNAEGTGSGGSTGTGSGESKPPANNDVGEVMHVHTYTKVTTSATCITEGVEKSVCSGCRDVKSESKISALGHNFKERWFADKAPTCTEGAYLTWSCERCGQSAPGGNVGPIPHTRDGGTVVRESSCTREGSILYTCTVCGWEISREEIPTKAHDWTTINKDGEEITYCRVCTVRKP